MTNPAIAPAFASDVDNCYLVADPCVIYDDDNEQYVLYFEAQYDDGITPNVGVGNVTGYATAPLADPLTWTYQGQVTGIPEGNYNMAFRVEYDGGHEWFMIPHQDGVSKLYRCTEFPHTWDFVRTLISTPEARDATIFQFGGNWYIYFSGTGSTPLYLYVSDDLLFGDFTEHPSSPLQTGSDKCRPGGRPIIRSDSVDIFVQKNDVTYGGGLRAFRLTNLTPTTCTIAELESSPILSASGDDGDWNEDGMHHLDRINSSLSLVDGKYLDGSGNDVWCIGIYRDVP